MKQKLLLCLLCLFALMGQSSWAAGKNRPQISLKSMFRPGGESVAHLKGGNVYYLDANLSLSYRSHSPIEIENAGNQPVVIHLRRNVTLDLRTSAVGLPAIHLPEGQKLIIAGDPHSVLIAYGGGAEAGGRGDNGGTGEVHECATWKRSYSGGGGRGGYGGRGGAPGIGGKSGVRANGGAGGERNSTDKNKPVSSDANANCIGKGGKAGNRGEAMGTLYVMGDVQVRALRGNGTDKIVEQSRPGQEKESQTCWSKMKASPGGGGGAGGNGAQANYDIGGGGSSGCGGGGGGAGALDGDNSWGHGLSYCKYAYGGGGRGARNGDGKFIQIYGLPKERGSFRTDDYHSAAGAVGGPGGFEVRQSNDGNTYKTPYVNIASSARKIDDLLPSSNPLHTAVNFTSPGVETAVFPNSYDFYYGMTMAKEVTKPKAKNPRMKFKGFYLNGDSKSQVYDERGKLNKQYTDLLRTFSDVSLTALWTGLTTVTCRMMLQNAMEDGYICDSTITKVVNLSRPTETLTLYSFENIPFGYSLSPKEKSQKQVVVNAGDIVTVDFLYDKNIHKITYTNNTPTAINLYDRSGKKVTTFSENSRFGNFIEEPFVTFNSQEDSVGYTRSWSDGVNSLMLDADITANLSAIPRKFAAFAKSVGKGHVKDCTMMKPDSVAYKTAHQWILRPDVGCDVAGVKLYRFSSNDETTAAEINGYKMLNDSVLSLESMPASDIIIVPEFKLQDYTVTVKYVDEKGQPTTGVESTFMTQEGNNFDELSDNPSGFKYNYTHNILMYAQKKTNPDLYYIEPEVTDAKGNKVETYNCLIDLKKMKVATIFDLAEEEGESEGSKREEVYNMEMDSLVVGYYYPAPASNTTVTFKVIERKKGTCYFANETEKCVIDSAFVNMKKQAEDIQPQITKSAQFSAFDIIGFVTSVTDTAAIKAGYWDEKNVYHQLEYTSMKVRVGGGRYKNFYFTFAPDAEVMTMGLAEGLRIIPAGISPLTQWSCQSRGLKGEKVKYEVSPTTNGAVIIDSILVKDVSYNTVYKLTETEGSFVMPDHHVFIYTYAHENPTLYKVTYLNINGDTLYVQEAPYNSAAEYHGGKPSIPSTADFIHYNFSGWYPELQPVTDDATYIAQYETYFVINENWGNNESNIINNVIGKRVNVELVRFKNITAGKYNTICLPFTLTREKIDSVFGKGTDVSEFRNINLTGLGLRYYDLNFYSTDHITASTPMLICPANEITDTIHIDNVLMEFPHPKSVIHRPAELCGCIDQTGAYFNRLMIWYIIDNKACNPASDNDRIVNGTHAYIYNWTGIDCRYRLCVRDVQGNIIFRQNDNEEARSFAPASIEDLQSEAESGVTRKVLFNGSLYILTGGHVYDALGNIVK